MTKSFRMDSSLAEMIAKTADGLQTTESAFVNEVLRSRIALEPIVRGFEGISLTRAVFTGILDLVDLAHLELLASRMAKQEVELGYDLLKLEKKQLSSFFLFIRIVLANAGKWFWLESGGRDSDNSVIILLHEYGFKWSSFLKAYFFCAFKLTLDITPEISLTDRLVRIDFSSESNRIF